MASRKTKAWIMTALIGLGCAIGAMYYASTEKGQELLAKWFPPKK